MKTICKSQQSLKEQKCLFCFKFELQRVQSCSVALYQVRANKWTKTADSWRDRHFRPRERPAGRQTETQAERQTERLTNRQTNRQTEETYDSTLNSPATRPRRGSCRCSRHNSAETDVDICADSSCSSSVSFSDLATPVAPVSETEQRGHSKEYCQICEEAKEGKKEGRKEGRRERRKVSKEVFKSHIQKLYQGKQAVIKSHIQLH